MTGSLVRPLTPVLLALAALPLLMLQSRLVPVDLVFLLLLAVAARSGAWPATLLGGWGGLLMGALRGNVSLPMGLLYALVGFLTGAYCETSGRERWLDLTCLVAGLTLMVSAGEAALLLAMGLTLDTARNQVIPQLICNLALGLPILLLMPERR